MIGRRIVFYIPGYDPRGARHYHQVYAAEAAKQASINGLAIAVAPLETVDNIEQRWRVSTTGTETDYRYLAYDDLIRRRWSKGPLSALAIICRSFFPLLARGVTWKVAKLSWPFAVTMVLPMAVVLAAVTVSIAAGLIVWTLSGFPAGLAAMLAVFVLLLALRHLLEKRWNFLWLASVFAFVADQGEGAADIEARIDRFALRIAAAPAADEILVIGHSTGAQIAVAALARALRQPGTARLSFLTLGSIIPALGLQPTATAFRAELAAVAADPKVDWIDFTAAIDGVCFPLTDPVAACGLSQPDPARPSPKLLSARFPKLFSRASYAALRRDRKRAHFQYLLATDLPGDYDYFPITAGDRSLAQRYAHLETVRDFNQFRLARR
ncbi:MAG: hypothetical protein HY245_01780 [Rhizobiales bacterium]|nr:hypothetical protein [Hyphomicrobiales bacterium]MBI3672158.1 hypothetical protein [Hyphomicrobiales bacterium]